MAGEPRGTWKSAQSKITPGARAPGSWCARRRSPDLPARELNTALDPVNMVRMTRTQFVALAAMLPAAADAQAKGKVFELRTYTTVSGRLPNLLARFQNHTVKLFEKHGMTNIGYWTPVEGQSGAGNTLVYMLAHDSVEAQKKSFDAFRADPEWIKARTESEKDGKIVDKVVSVTLQATAFSKLK